MYITLKKIYSNVLKFRQLLGLNGNTGRNMRKEIVIGSIS